MKGNIDGQITTTGDHPESAYELYIYLSKEARSPAIEIRKTHPHTQADEGEGIIVVGRRMTHIKGLPDNVGELDALLPGLATPVKILGNGSTEHEKAIDAILTAMKDIHLGIERIPSVASPRSQIRSNAAER